MPTCSDKHCSICRSKGKFKKWGKAFGEIQKVRKAFWNSWKNSMRMEDFTHLAWKQHLRMQLLTPSLEEICFRQTVWVLSKNQTKLWRTSDASPTFRLAKSQNAERIRGCSTVFWGGRGWHLMDSFSWVDTGDEYDKAASAISSTSWDLNTYGGHRGDQQIDVCCTIALCRVFWSDRGKISRVIRYSKISTKTLLTHCIDCTILQTKIFFFNITWTDFVVDSVFQLIDSCIFPEWTGSKDRELHSTQRF